MIKSRRMRWAGHVAGMMTRGMYRGIWWEGQKETDNYKEVDADGRLILRWILENPNGSGLAQDRGRIEGFCEHDNEHLSIRKCWEILQ
jgi:hypothetical protein